MFWELTKVRSINLIWFWMLKTVIKVKSIIFHFQNCLFVVCSHGKLQFCVFTLFFHLQDYHISTAFQLHRDKTYISTSQVLITLLSLLFALSLPVNQYFAIQFLLLFLNQWDTHNAVGLCASSFRFFDCKLKCGIIDSTFVHNPHRS